MSLFSRTVATASVIALGLATSPLNGTEDNRSVGVEKSVVSLVEKLEDPSQLSSTKYAPQQFRDIMNLLEYRSEKVRVVSWCHVTDLDRAATVLATIAPDIICLQQVKHDDVHGMVDRLGSDFAIFCGLPEGWNRELPAMIYRKDRISIVENRVLPLPAEKECQADELVTSVRVVDLLTKKTFDVMNTHLTFSSADVREQQMRYVLKELPSSVPTVLAASMNSFPNRPDKEKLPFFDGDYLYRMTTRSICDTKEKSLLGHVGPIATYTNADDEGTPYTGEGTPGVILDHLFASDGVAVIVHATEPATVDGKYPAEHMPVFADVVME